MPLDLVFFMSHTFKKISVLGGGLLGGSVILALRGKVDSRLWMRRPEAVEIARSLISHSANFSATGDLAEVVADCDLLILAVPVGAMAALLSAAIEAGLPTNCLITDVGSVKQTPHRELGPILEKSGNPFIGSHPMAGSEQNGLQAADALLFQNAACLLTNDSGAPEELCAELENFWKSLGCRTKWFAAAEHDRIVARISHLPHITAAATALSALGGDCSYGELAGGGLRDTSRVASGNPAMWAEILTENKQAVVAELRDNIGHLNDVLASLEEGDLEAAREWLEGAKKLRDTLK